MAGDAHDLGRALRNLADNAARHARTQATLRVSLRDGWGCVEVTDDGPGVPDGAPVLPVGASARMIGAAFTSPGLGDVNSDRAQAERDLGLRRAGGADARPACRHGGALNCTNVTKGNGC
ncbi:ATP-binding protein [Micromonospora sp. NBC_00617]|uniref:ATP-binding protein n=1 Tax=Micromonospora sp. NBC_00617 TaxID=2903587 RepID=UPI0030E4C0D2